MTVKNINRLGGQRWARDSWLFDFMDMMMKKICWITGALILSLLPVAAQADNPDGELRIEIISAYNLVVDSNVTTPATYAPEAATLGAKVCNDGTEVMHEVQVYIGDYIEGGTSTPGSYPVFDSAGDSRTWLADTGEYSLTHESGSFANNEDASRAWVGTLEPGECRVEYWVVSYPRCVNVGGTPQEPPCDTAITGGSTTADDLSLSYDIWATGSYGAAETPLEAEDSRNLTLRSEISASANKIWPNGDNKVPDEYKAAIQESLGWDTWTPTGSNPFPGQVFETQGIWYDLGNVNQGFDNNNDGVPDQNAWLQPVGIPDVYDPGCFRLVGTYGLLIVKLSSGGEQLIPFKDQMYFENIPDNTGVVGLVFYEYAALNGKCTGTLTPYQEVASGYLNEKFSGDYGTAFQITTQEPKAYIEKGVLPTTAALGSTLTYTLEVTNPDDYGVDSEGDPLTVTIGNPDYGAPVVIRDSIPDGVDYEAGSAKFIANDSNVTQTGTILYSTDDGNTWSTTEPAVANTVTDIEWRMDVPLTSDDSAGANTMKVEFQATVPGTYTEPFVSNTGCAAIGSGPCFDEDDAVTLITGVNTISGTVFLDDSGPSADGTAANGVMDGSETGEGSVTVTLYYDMNGDGVLDPEDVKWGETSTDPTTGDYSFTNLPDAKFIAVVDSTDGDLTPGVAATTDTEIPADTTSGDVTDVDFGFLPPLEVTKRVLGSEPYADGEIVSYELKVKNILPAGTSTPSGCYYDLYPSSAVLSAGGYINPENLTAKDGVYGYADLGTANNDTVDLDSFELPPIQSGAITDINVVFFDSSEREGTVGSAEYFTNITIAGTTYGYDDKSTLLITSALGGEYEVDLGAVTTNWTELQGGVTAVLNAAKKNDSTGNWQLDAYALRVYTDSSCPDNNEWTINPVPLKDEFASADFTFVSAVPAETTYDATTINWDNVGPLAPGEEATVIVNLRATATAAEGNKTANNEAIVEEGTAFFLDGRPANGDSHDVNIILRPAIDLSGTVFSDLDTLGVAYVNGTDALMSNVPVHLYACVDEVTGIPVEPSSANNALECDQISPTASWQLVDTVYTDSTLTDGHNYIFEGVPYGYYYVEVDESGYVADGNETYEPADGTSLGGYNSCTNPAGNDSCTGGWDDTFNLGNTDLGNFAVIDSTVDTAGDVTDVDFGFQVDPGVSGYLWDDADGDGVWDDGEAPLTGVTVTLDGVSVTTDENGYYQFTGQDVTLTDGANYQITVTTTSGDMAGSAWTEIFEADGSTDNSLTFTATAGTMLTDQNFGWTRTPVTQTVDGTVYYDLNINADQNDPTVEIGVDGATVYLYQDKNQNGQIDPGEDGLVAQTTTDANGDYAFTNLPDGDYLVVVDEASAGLDSYQQTEDPDLGTSVLCGGLSCDGDAQVSLSGAGDADNDFGYQLTGPGTIGDFVWIDTDGDGLQDDGADSGIAGVTVTLEWDPDGDGNYTVLTTTTTSDGTMDLDGDNIPDPAGSYLFTDLPEGDYRVVVDTTDADLPTDDFGNSYSPSTDVQYDVNVTAGSPTSMDNDFGFTPSGAIGDSIYWDVNGDGTQGTNEPGIEGVTVELYTFTDDNGNGKWDDGEAKTPTGLTKQTDADGKYLFTGLADDNYFVQVSDGVGTPINGADQTADPDSDGLICTDSTLTVPCDNGHGVSINGNSYMGADFGYEPPLFIGDQLFIDMDGDGSPMENNDLPLAYVTVTLTDCGPDKDCATTGDNETYTTQTDENGNYAFVDGLVDGNKYIIEVDTNDEDLPAEYGALTPSYNGHDSDGTTDSSIELTLGSVPIDDADMGFKFPVINNTLSGTVCLEGSSVDGYCGSGLNLTDGVAGDESAYEGTTVYVSKWIDDGDGIVESGELFPITQTVTDENGDYSFTGLPSVSGSNESYLVSLDAPADLLELTTKLTDTPPDTPADALKEYIDLDGHTTSVWQSISVADGNTVAGLDFAFQQTAAFDFGDLPLPFETKLAIDGARHLVPDPVNPDLYLGAGVTIETDGKPSAGASADEDDGVTKSGTWTEGTNGGTLDITAYGAGWLVGWIDFNGDGSFSGTDEMIINQAFGTAGASFNDSIPFDIPTGGLSSPGYARFRFFPEEPPVPSIAFKGIADNGEVEDYLFNLGALSAIGDEILLLKPDGTTEGIEGVVVELQNEFCNAGVDCPTAVTDANGHYLFTGVGLGDYTVVVKEGISGLTQVYDPDSTVDGQHPVSVTTAGTEYLDADFWYAASAPTTGTIGDRIWNDADGDGVQDLGESGIGGITVVLKYSDGSTVYEADGITPVTATTGPDGSYLFVDVASGDYKVEVDTTTLPAGVTQTGDPDVPGAHCGGSCDGTTATITITSAGETILTADFGYQFPEANTSDIGDTIYHEDIGGIAGVTVVLKDTNGDIIAQDVTDSNGNYLFPGLPPGDYTVEVTDTNGQLDSYVLTVDPDSDDSASDGLPESYSVTVTGADTCDPATCADADFGYNDPVPTYATVSSFNAYVNTANQVVLEWTTASEIGTIGFHLERLNEQSGEYQAVTKKLLPGMLAPPHGGTYRFVDKQAKPGKGYTYRVVEVALDNQGVISGPYVVQASKALPVNNQMFADGPEGYTLAHQDFSRKQLKRFTARSKFVQELAAAKKKKTGNTLKIPVKKNGLVYLTAVELAELSGMTRVKVEQSLRAKKCLLTLSGESIPVITSNTGSGLWFYGQGPDRRDVSHNVYLLELGKKGVKIKNTPGRPEKSVEVAQSYLAQVRLEENHQPLYFYNINKPLDDFWAWEYLFAYGNEYVLVHTVDTPYVTGEGMAMITVNLVSVANKKSSSAAPYKVAVLLNGHEIGTTEWSEKGAHSFQSEIPANWLYEDGNEVQIVSQLNRGVNYSLIYLDSIEVDYQRSYEVVDSKLSFSAADYDSVTIRGFKSSNVLALDITEPTNPLRLRTLPGKNQAGEYTITVSTKPGHDYYVVGASNVNFVGSITVDTPSQLRSAENQADYLVITSINLMDSAQRLADHRASEGMRTMIVDIEDVQDEFSHSLPDPEAIRDFLSYVYTHWSLVPKYVTLIGDGSYDYNDYMGYGAPLVPSVVVSTPDGFYPSDSVLADVVDDDGVPEYAIGRIPVVDSEELDRYIDKVMAYEHALEGGSKTMTLVTDQKDPLAGDFRASTDQVAALMPEYVQVDRLDADTLGYNGVKNGINVALREGSDILHYTGHSSWIGYGSNSSLMSSNSLASMNDLGSPMLMVSMACSAASFGYPPMDSVGESALLQADGAAVGFFGATGLSHNYLSDIMAEGFYKSLFDPAITRIGEAVQAGKRHYQSQGMKRYPLDIYNLLGDPAAHTPVNRQ